MPLFVQPVLRARQEAMEAEGLIIPNDSALVTIFKAQEAQGLKPKVVPLIINVLRDHKYVAS